MARLHYREGDELVTVDDGNKHKWKNKANSDHDNNEESQQAIDEYLKFLNRRYNRLYSSGDKPKERQYKFISRFGQVMSENDKLQIQKTDYYDCCKYIR